MFHVHSLFVHLTFRHANKQEKDKVLESLQGITKAKIQDPAAPELSVENLVVANSSNDHIIKGITTTNTENSPVICSSAGPTARNCLVPALNPNLILNTQPAAPIADIHSLSVALASQTATLKQQLGMP